MDGFDVVLIVFRWMAKNPGKTLAILVVLTILGGLLNLFGIG